MISRRTPREESAKQPADRRSKESDIIRSPICYVNDISSRVRVAGRPESYAGARCCASVSVEAPGASCRYDLKVGLVLTIEKAITWSPLRRLVGQLERVRPKPLGADYRDDRAWQDPADGSAGLQIFECWQRGA